jgi:hypothetical protein
MDPQGSHIGVKMKKKKTFFHAVSRNVTSTRDDWLVPIANLVSSIL